MPPMMSWKLDLVLGGCFTRGSTWRARAARSSPDRPGAGCADWERIGEGDRSGLGAGCSTGTGGGRLRLDGRGRRRETGRQSGRR